MSNRKTWHSAGYLILTALLTVNQPFAQDELPVTDDAAQECPALTISADSPQQSRLREIYRNQDVCINERVEIRGEVEQYVEGPEETTGAYYLSDDFGVWIKIRTPDIESLPVLNSRVIVVGVVGYDRVRIDRRPDDWRTDYPEPVLEYLQVERGGIYINEPFMHVVQSGPEPPCPDGQVQNAAGNCVCPDGSTLDENGICVPSDVEVIEDGESGIRWLWIFVGLAALVLIGLGIALVRTLGSKPATSTGTTTRVPGATPPRTPTGSTMPTDSGASAPTPRIVEGKTIKMHLPPDDKTVKVLPGRFKVKGGLDDITEVRFFMPQGRSTTEITFGRVEGRPYEHIQLKPRTVSSRQAKLVFDGGKYTLYNHASTESNPTTHNGRALGEGESVLLTDRDRITMGEVEFEFASS